MSLTDLVTEELVLQIKDSASAGDNICVVWLGRANARRPAETLKPYLELLLREAQANKRGLEFQMQQLEHVNSATLVEVMRLIKALKGVGVRLRITYDGAQKWQKMAFGALSSFVGPDGLLAVEAS